MSGPKSSNPLVHTFRWGLAAAPLILAAGCATPVPVMETGPTIEAPADVTEQTPVPLEPATAPNAPLFSNYVGMPEILRTGTGTVTMATGAVFEDTNRNSLRDPGEPGLEGVKVSNGRDVVLTDADGNYALPVRDDMAVFVVQPAGYQVPHNGSWVPQFAYQHKPAGTPKTLRYGGLPATGPLPHAINFPLARISDDTAFDCVILGDTQAYANQEISYFRDSTIDDLLDRGEEARADCIIAVGDVMGDDLDLIPRMADVIGTLQAPQWWVHGNHDFDFDADFDEDSADSWRRLWGPNYYAFEIGDALFIVLDNVVYPCTREDAELPGRDYCVEGERKRYNGRITDDQMTFVENLLANTDEDKLVVLAHHIPLVSFVDQSATAHQTDNINALYALLEGREALSLSGHTHTIENHSPGDSFAGWSDAVGVTALPFRHIVAGAASGAWYNGDFDVFGVPMAVQRLGGPKGWLDLEIDGADYLETYRGANLDRDQRMWVSLNTPGFRDWFSAIMDWYETPRDERDALPPRSIKDLPDVKILTAADLEAGTYVTANVWDGSSETSVVASIGEMSLELERTQPARGEGLKSGPEWADPFATQRQLSVARWAYESTSGETRNQGWEAYKGSSFGPAAPQPQFSIADRSSHLWRVALPESLPVGVHAVAVTSTDRHGRESTETIVIEVRQDRPQMRFRSDVFNAFEDGPPVRQ